MQTGPLVTTHVLSECIRMQRTEWTLLCPFSWEGLIGEWEKDRFGEMILKGH